METANKKSSTYTLSKPITVDGQLYSELNFDFDSLTAKDMISIDQSLQTDGIIVANMAELSKSYLIYVAARAAKINVKIFEELSLKDATRITAIAQTFLLQAS